MTTSRTPSIVVDATRPAHHSLVAPERDVLTGRLTSVDRDDKGSRPDDAARAPGSTWSPKPEPPPVARPRGRARMVGAVGGLVVVLAVGGVLIANAVSGPDPGAPGAPTGAGASAGAGASGGPGTAGGSGGAAGTGDLPPELDPALITAYEYTSTRTAVEVGPDVEIPPDEQVGSVFTGSWPCVEGDCLLWYTWRLPAGTESFSESIVDDSFGDAPCFPITQTIELVRGPDGSYHGTIRQDPAQVSAARYEVGDGTLGWCNAIRLANEVVLTPVVASP